MTYFLFSGNGKGGGGRTMSLFIFSRLADDTIVRKYSAGTCDPIFGDFAKQITGPAIIEQI